MPQGSLEPSLSLALTLRLVEGAAEGSGGRSSPTSQRGSISLSPAGSGHVWTDTQADCPCHDPSSRTRPSVPWQQQLVKNVSVSGWEKNGQPGKRGMVGAALLSHCTLSSRPSTHPLSPSITYHHLHKATPQTNTWAYLCLSLHPQAPT